MPHLSSIHTLIDFSKDNDFLVFYGTAVPIDKLFQLYDRNNITKSVDEFLHQYPEVERIAVYAVLALAGRYSASALESFLSYSPGELSDQVWGSHVPHTIDEFKVDWGTLIASAQNVPTDQFRYFAKVYHYGNTADGVVFGRIFEFRRDLEFERLLEHSLKYRVFDNFVPVLFGKTLISADLIKFAPTSEELQTLLTRAQFRRVSPFYLEAELSEYLYHTGIYHRFFKDHTMLEAQEITRDFLDQILGQNPEERLCLISRYPWGEWFDEHSCTDLTIIGINRTSNQIWLFTISDSD